jgi:hypothetical protein
MTDLSDLNEGDAIPELKVTPDKYLPHRYAGASGDFNPIHIDPEFAKAVGLPGNILHGLWMMAQVARGNAALADGDPRALKRLSVQFRGMGLSRAGAGRERDGQGGLRRPPGGRHGRCAGRQPGDQERPGGAERGLALAAFLSSALC